MVVFSEIQSFWRVAAYVQASTSGCLDLNPKPVKWVFSRKVQVMKKSIHPEYVEATVTCGCGHKFTTRSTRKAINVEICSACHPFFTGKMKFVDTTGRVERFQKKYGKWAGQKPAEAK